MNENTCICCGLGIPEGLQVCPACEREAFQTKHTKLTYSRCWCGSEARPIVGCDGGVYEYCRDCGTTVYFGERRAAV